MSKDLDKELQEGIYDKIYQFQKVYQPNTQDSPIIDLCEDRDDGNLICDPEYQRRFVWSEEKQSSFIESILYGIDTPIIYFVEAKHDFGNNAKLVKEVIDGRQRLETIFRFRNNQLTLTGLKKNSPLYDQLENTSYKSLLPKLQNAFKGYSIRTVTFKLVDSKVDIDTQLKFKYQLFQRYNSGLTALNQQELRNCIYHKSEFSKTFKNIAQSDIFLTLCPYFKDDVRMGGDEFVGLLYFLTWLDASVDLYALESKNPFIDFCFEKIETNEQIYNLNIFTNDQNDLELSNEDELDHEDNQINEDEVRTKFFSSTEKVMLDTLKKVKDIYDTHLTHVRSERYLIEVLYYYAFVNKKISRAFVLENGTAFGNYINDEIIRLENSPNPAGQDFNLTDCFIEKVAHTVRIKYKFAELGRIINRYFKN